jgi:hypothetical protein
MEEDMRTLIALAAMLSFGFTIFGTAPSMDNRGTCASPIPTANLSDSVTISIAYTGPATGADSLRVAKNRPFSFTLPDLLGTFTVTGWARDAGGRSCPAVTTYTVRDTLAPAAPTIGP